LINDLVNRELIRKDFKFTPPVFTEDKEEIKGKVEIEVEEDEGIEAVEEFSKDLNLAKYLRDSNMDTEITPHKAELKDAEQEYPESPVNPKEWENEYRRVRERLKDAAQIDKKDKLMFNTRKLNKNFQKFKDIMELAGHSVINNYVFQCESSIKTITQYEKRLNASIPPELVF
jgi:hypothetical protein